LGVVAAMQQPLTIESCSLVLTSTSERKRDHGAPIAMNVGYPMRNSLKLTIAGALLAGSVGVASAADLRRPPPPPPPPPIPMYNWSGFYIGVQGGFGWADLDHTLVTTGLILPGDRFTTETSGGLFGGTVGFNWQAGAWVFGFEADYAWADISRRFDNCFGIAFVTCRTGLDSFGTARLRLGGAWGPALIYATGGLAFGDHVAEVIDERFDPRVSFGRSEFAVGWTVGGGIEWGFAPGWSFKAEALYFDLDVDRLNTANFVVNDRDILGIDHQLTGVIVRGGINYRFNWGGPAGPVVGSY
jgi:outer membrane immunogenic protein